MNLPFVLDVAIGLIFTFLILSLLASEIQELISTLLQWRAKHLKKAIEDLLAGGSEGILDPKSEEVGRVISLVNKLYEHPLINTLNHESKGLRTRALQSKSQSKSTNVTSRSNSKTGNGGENVTTNNNEELSISKEDLKNIFDNRNSAPSYIPSETFASGLLKTLRFRDFAQKPEIYQLMNLENLKKDIFKKIQSLLSKGSASLSTKEQEKLNSSFEEFKKKIDEVIRDFREEEKDLSESINSIEEELQNFISRITPGSYFARRLENFKRNIFPSEAAKEKIKEDFQPNLTTIINIYKEIKNIDKNSETYKKIKESYEEIVGEIDKMHLILPDSLIESLSVLARRTQIKAKNTEEQILQFQKEIETWFDRSMERSMGVYKRNTRKMLLAIGLILSGAVNADTINIASRLSEDTALRNIITQNAPEIFKQCAAKPTREDCVNDKAREALKDASLPVGWTESNLKQQLGLTKQQNNWNWNKIDLIQKVKRLFQMLLGWCLSTLAISMGASFWFDLLGKVINVRNTGAKPVSDTRDRPSPDLTKEENGS